MRFLVTGGAGFIGSHLVDALLSRDMGEVRVLDNFVRGRRAFLCQHEGDPRLTIQDGDIRDSDCVDALCKGADVVFHLAAQSNVLGASQDMSYSAGTNVMGTVNVLKASLEAGVSRVIFTSSREAYGDPQCLPVNEGAVLAPKNLYGASKVAGEMYCNAFRNKELDVRVLRLANVYGPRDRDRVIPLWIGRAEAGTDLEVFGGQQVIDFISVDVVVEALIRASQVPCWLGPVNIGSGTGTAITDLARRILDVTESSASVIRLPARPEEVIGYVADVALMESFFDIPRPVDPLSSLQLLVKEPALS